MCSSIPSAATGRYARLVRDATVLATTTLIDRATIAHPCSRARLNGNLHAHVRLDGPERSEFFASGLVNEPARDLCP